MAMAKLVIFTDIDGTIMDLTTFSMDPVLDVIPKIKEYKIPIIFASAKTKTEQEKIRKRLGIRDPFIVENGGGIYIPHKYFNFSLEKILEDYFEIKKTTGYTIVSVGKDYKKIQSILKEIKSHTNLPFIGFGDLTAKEVSRLTGLSIKDARNAKQRDFDETIIIDEKYLPKLKEELARYGLKCIFGGRFFHIMDKRASKGLCVNTLKKLYTKKYNDSIITIGCGDSKNDLTMLKEVDIPILVEKKGGGFTNISLPGLIRVKGEGPIGWKNGILNIIEKYHSNN